MPNETRLSVAEAARILGVNSETARQYMATGKLVGSKTAKGLRQVWTTTPAAVRAFAEAYTLLLDEDLFARVVQTAQERATYGKAKNG